MDARVDLRVQELDDARADAMVGVVEAVDAYDPARGGFPGFASTVIWRRVVDGYRARRMLPAMSLESAVSSEVGLQLHEVLGDPSPSPLDEVVRADEAAHVQFALTVLPERERGLVWGRYAEERTAADVSRDYGLTASGASTVSLKALDKLRRHYGVTVSVVPTPRRRRPVDGRRNARRKIDEEHVRMIHRRLLSGEETQKEIAASIGLSEGQLSLIKTGKRWRHVFEEFHCKEAS